MTSLLVSIQAQVRDRASWLALAAKVEADRFVGLSVSDHPGAGAAPFVALAAAAAVTERIRLGSYVVNAGLWEPMALAGEVATLDVLSGGRAVLGVGAGHTPGEWTTAGRPFPSAGERVDRMIEVVDAVRALLKGEAVSVAGHHVTLADATMVDPRPVQAVVPVLVGGNGARVLTYAAKEVDLVGVTGLARTLEDGHNHEVDWTAGGVARTFDLIRDAAARAGRSPGIDVLVQHVTVTDDAEATAAEVAEHVTGASGDDLLAAPFVWIGTATEIAAQLSTYQRDLGVTSFTVRAPAMDQAREVVAAADLGTGLHGHDIDGPAAVGGGR